MTEAVTKGSALTEQEWAELKERFPRGAAVTVMVSEHVPFGMFVTLPGAEGVSALVEAISYRPGGNVADPADWPGEGTPLDAVVSGYRDHLQQIVLHVGPPISGGSGQPTR